MKAYMSAYGKAIIQETGCRPEDTEQVEEVMRTQHSTLDHLTRTVFRRLAKDAWSVVKSLRISDPDIYPTPKYSEPAVP